MIKPRILAILMAIVLFGCKEIPSSMDTPDDPAISDPAISTPEGIKKDTLRMRPARREFRQKEGEARKKGLDTLKPVTT